MRKEKERFYLDKFKSLFNGFPIGDISESEQPDFLVHTSTGIVGVEVTEVHRPKAGSFDSAQINQVACESIVYQAQADYEKLGHPVLYVTVHFNISFSVQKKDIPRLKESLLAVVIRNIPDLGKESSEEANWLDRKGFPEEIYKVTVRRPFGQTKNFFSTPVVAWVSNLSNDSLAEAVAAKERKVSVYRQKCDQLWLLMVSDTRHVSTWFDSDQDINRAVMVSEFDRIFLLRNFSGRVAELEVVRPNCLKV